MGQAAGSKTLMGVSKRSGSSAIAAVGGAKSGSARSRSRRGLGVGLLVARVVLVTALISAVAAPAEAQAASKPASSSKSAVPAAVRPATSAALALGARVAPACDCFLGTVQVAYKDTTITSNEPAGDFITSQSVVTKVAYTLNLTPALDFQFWGGSGGSGGASDIPLSGVTASYSNKETAVYPEGWTCTSDDEASGTAQDTGLSGPYEFELAGQVAANTQVPLTGYLLQSAEPPVIDAAGTYTNTASDPAAGACEDATGPWDTAVSNPSWSLMQAAGADIQTLTGSTTIDESQIQTDPYTTDSASVALTWNLHYASGDTDGDGINDFQENYEYGTDPGNADSDGDGWPDGVEVAAGTNPVDGSSHPGTSAPTAGDSRSGGSGDTQNDGCSCGDPVNTATGEFWSKVTDIAVPGRGVPLSLGRAYTSTSDAAGRFGNGWTDSYDESLAVAGSAVTVTESNGGTIAFTEIGPNEWIAPARYTVKLTHNSGGSWLFTRADGTSLRFSSTGVLTSESDRNGYVTGLHYNSAGQLVTVTDPEGRSLTLVYSGSHVTSVTDPLGYSLAYRYDTAGELISVKDRTGATTGYTYSPSGSMTSWTDGRGGTTTIAYDSTARALSTTDPLGHATTYTYASGPGGTSVTTQTTPGGRKKAFAYLNQQLVSTTSSPGTALAAITAYTYDPVTDNVASVTDPDGNTVIYTYDTQGNRTSTSKPDGSTSRATWDLAHDLLSFTNFDNHITVYTYDGAGNPLTTSEYDSNDGATLVTTARYSTSHPGDLVSVKDPRGYTTAYTYDAYGDQTSSTDPDGNVTSAIYDADGRRVTTTTPRGNSAGATPAAYTTAYTYDNDGRPLTVIDPLGATTAATYDPDGNTTKVVDPDGATTLTSYDADNRPTKVINATPAGTALHSTTTAYNSDGYAISQTVGTTITTTSTYDPLGRLATVTTAGHTTAYTYDRASNLTATRDPSGETTTYTYDVINRLTNVSFSDAAPSLAYYYDSAGRLLETTDGTGTTSSVYDSLGDLTSRTDGAGKHISYAYNHDGELTKLTYPNSKSVTRTIDPAGRITAITDWLSNTTAFGYDADGNLTTETPPNSTAVTTGYNADDAVTAITAVSTSPAPATLLALTDTRSAANLVTAEIATQPGGSGTTSYARDGIERLTAATAGNYTYNTSDQVTQLASAAAGTPTSLTYNTAGELTTAATGTTNTTYGYNPQGQRTSAGSATYGWDQTGNLTSYNNGTTTAGYTYDAVGLRTSVKIGKTTGHATYDTRASIPLTLSDGTNYYIYGPDNRPLEQIAATTSTVNYYVHDQLGSTRLLTEPSGTVTAGYAYSPYGLTTHTGAASTPLTFTGQYTDPTTGLVHLDNRYYDPATAQFLSIDPLNAVTGQPYAYANDNPIDNADPAGLSWVNNVVSAGEGYGDAFTGGATKWIRTNIESGLGTTDIGNENSGYYTGGEVIGTGAAVAVDGIGAASGLGAAGVGSFEISTGASWTISGLGVVQAAGGCTEGDSTDCALGIAGVGLDGIGRVNDRYITRDLVKRAIAGQTSILGAVTTAIGVTKAGLGGDSAGSPPAGHC